jgi:hypothetical protein
MVGREIWAFLFLLGILLFNWPSLEIFSAFLPYYLFVAWGVFILALGLFISSLEKKGKKDV